MLTAEKKGYTLPAHKLRQTPPSRPSRPTPVDTTREKKKLKNEFYHYFIIEIFNMFQEKVYIWL